LENEQLQEMIASYCVETDRIKKVYQGLQIAHFYLKALQDTEVALLYIQEVIKTSDEVQNPSELSNIYYKIGWLFKLLQDTERLKQAFQKAIYYGEIAQDDGVLVGPHIDLGHFFVDELNHSSALDHFDKALRIAERLDDNNLIGIALSGVGRAYLESHDYTKALFYIRKALKILPAKSTQIQSCYVNLGITYAKLEDNTLAIGYYKRVIPLLKEQNNLRGIAEMYCRISETYESIQKTDKALEYAFLAQNFVQENQINDFQIDCYIYLIFVRVHSGKKNIAEAEKYIQKFLSLGVTDREYLFSFYDIVTGFYASQQRYDLAYQYMIKYTEMGRTIFNEDMQIKMAIRAEHFEYEREKEKAELLKQQKEQLEFVINNAYESIFMISGNTFTLVNDAFYTMTGWNQEKLNDKDTDFLDIIDPAERENLWFSIKKNIENQLTHFEINTRIITLDGELIDVEIHFSSISTDDDLKLIGIIHDIAQKKLYEEQKLHFEKINTIITFAVTTNDFINSPLMAIQGYVEMIQENIHHSKMIPDKIFENIFHSIQIINEKMHELVEFANNPHMQSIPTQKYSHTDYNMLSFNKVNKNSE